MDAKTKFGIYTLIVIIFQSCLKIIGVILTGSLSFLSESIDTLTDFVFISITLYALIKSVKPPDFEYMYGYSKIDSIGAMMEGIILICLYGFLLMNAIQTLIRGEHEIYNVGIGLQILIISFIVNIFFSRYLIWQGKRRNSYTLKIQGLNLFQDSMRAIVVIVSFVFALFRIFYTDIIFSMALSIWIIIGALKLTKEGITDISDTNPIKSLILEDIRQKIFNLDHVHGVEDLKIRASGNKLFLEVHLSVEDHISLVRAHEITTSIKTLSKKIFPRYDVECFVEMNPLGGERSVGENLINLVHSMKSEFPKIVDVKDLNIFSFEDKYFLSVIMIVDESLSLKEAHDTCTDFENELKKIAPQISRIITHIEAQPRDKTISPKKTAYVSVEPEKIEKNPTIDRKIT